MYCKMICFEKAVLYAYVKAKDDSLQGSRSDFDYTIKLKSAKGSSFVEATLTVEGISFPISNWSIETHYKGPFEKTI